MSIKTNIEGVMKEIHDGNVNLAITIQTKAVEAIKAGEGSAEWVDYMGMFSKNAEQLARLKPTDSTQGNFEMDVARTYLVGNGVCGAATTGSNLNFGIGDQLDKNLGES